MIDDPTSLLSLGIWLMAAGMYPLGFLFGACSPCCKTCPVEHEFNRCVRFERKTPLAPKSDLALDTTQVLNAYSRRVSRPEDIGGIWAGDGEYTLRLNNFWPIHIQSPSAHSWSGPSSQLPTTIADTALVARFLDGQETLEFDFGAEGAWLVAVQAEHPYCQASVCNWSYFGVSNATLSIIHAPQVVPSVARLTVFVHPDADNVNNGCPGAVFPTRTLRVINCSYAVIETTCRLPVNAWCPNDQFGNTPLNRDPNAPGGCGAERFTPSGGAFSTFISIATPVASFFDGDLLRAIENGPCVTTRQSNAENQPWTRPYLVELNMEGDFDAGIMCPPPFNDPTDFNQNGLPDATGIAMANEGFACPGPEVTITLPTLWYYGPWVSELQNCYYSVAPVAGEGGGTIAAGDYVGNLTQRTCTKTEARIEIPTTLAGGGGAGLISSRYYAHRWAWCRGVDVEGLVFTNAVRQPGTPFVDLADQVGGCAAEYMIKGQQFYQQALASIGVTVQGPGEVAPVQSLVMPVGTTPDPLPPLPKHSLFSGQPYPAYNATFTWEGNAGELIAPANFQQSVSRSRYDRLLSVKVFSTTTPIAGFAPPMQVMVPGDGECDLPENYTRAAAFVHEGVRTSINNYPSGSYAYGYRVVGAKRICLSVWFSARAYDNVAEPTCPILSVDVVDWAEAGDSRPWWIEDVSVVEGTSLSIRLAAWPATGSAGGSLGGDFTVRVNFQYGHIDLRIHRARN